MTGRANSNRNRPHLAFAAGLLALFLQVLAPVLPSAAMASAMDLVAASSEEAASFAATCLGLGRPDADPGANQPVTGHQAKCPICLSVAQGKDVAPLAASVATSLAWTVIEPTTPANAPVAKSAGSAFTSRAPPAAA
jgi:hypothetical protein